MTSSESKENHNYDQALEQFSQILTEISLSPKSQSLCT